MKNILKLIQNFAIHILSTLLVAFSITSENCYYRIDTYRISYKSLLRCEYFGTAIRICTPSLKTQQELTNYIITFIYIHVPASLHLHHSIPYQVILLILLQNCRHQNNIIIMVLFLIPLFYYFLPSIEMSYSIPPSVHLHLEEDST